MVYWEGPEFQKCLTELQPEIGNYEWMWKLLKWRSKDSGWLPNRLYKILKRLGNPRRPYFVGTTEDGLKFIGDYRDRWAVNSVVIPNFDGDVRDSLKQMLTDSPGAFVDLGTNLGIVASAMAKHIGSSETVYAFEPIEATCKRAAATFALNGLTNIRLFPLAVGDMDGEITFFDAPGRSEGASANKTNFDRDGNWEGWRETKVLCRTMDSLRADGSVDRRVGVLKIDVEGNELKVIQGATQLISQDNPAILFEYYPYVARGAGWVATDITGIIDRVGKYEFQTLNDGHFAAYPPDPASEEIVDIYCRPVA